MHRNSEITQLMHFERSFGEMAEWSIASVLKTDVLRGTGGSNPSLSAITMSQLTDYQFVTTFFFYTKTQNQTHKYLKNTKIQENLILKVS